MLLHFYFISFLNINFSFKIKLTKWTSPMALQTSVLMERAAAPSDSCQPLWGGTCWPVRQSGFRSWLHLMRCRTGAELQGTQTGHDLLGMGMADGQTANLAVMKCLKTRFLVLLPEADSRCLDGAWKSVPSPALYPQARPAALHWQATSCPQTPPSWDTYALFPGKAGISWEAAPRHNQKLFPYEEHSEMEILKLML